MCEIVNIFVFLYIKNSTQMQVSPCYKNVI